jgi:hypothetical protein
MYFSVISENGDVYNTEYFISGIAGRFQGFFDLLLLEAWVTTAVGMSSCIARATMSRESVDGWAVWAVELKVASRNGLSMGLSEMPGKDR